MISLLLADSLVPSPLLLLCLLWRLIPIIWSLYLEGHTAESPALSSPSSLFMQLLPNPQLPSLHQFMLQLRLALSTLDHLCLHTIYSPWSPGCFKGTSHSTWSKSCPPKLVFLIGPPSQNTAPSLWGCSSQKQGLCPWHLFSLSSVFHIQFITKLCQFYSPNAFDFIHFSPFPP